jgi:multidrug transporter EmrE-like cation transporter
MQLVLSSVAALSFTVGGIFMKHANGLQNHPAAALFLLFFMVGAAMQSHAMRGAELGTTYLLVLGLEAAFALAFGTFLFAEPLTIVKLTAVVLIVTGIALLRM